MIDAGVHTTTIKAHGAQANRPILRIHGGLPGMRRVRRERHRGGPSYRIEETGNEVHNHDVLFSFDSLSGEYPDRAARR